MQAGQRGAVEGAEAQHHALFVRLHAIEAAGEPQRHDAEADQREAAAAGEAAARATAAEQGADVGLQPGDQLHRGRAAGLAAGPPAERPPNGPPGRRHGPPPPGPLAIATADRRRCRVTAGRRRPAIPHGLGPPLFEDMRTFLCGLGPRRERWRIGRHAPYPRNGRHHGGLLIDRRQKVCKQMTTDTDAPTALREALRAITDPASGKDIVTAGLVEGIELRGSLVQVALLTDRAHAAAMEPVRRAVEALLARQPGITNATAVLTAHKAPRAAARRRQPRGTGMATGTARSRRCCCRT